MIVLNGEKVNKMKTEMETGFFSLRNLYGKSLEFLVSLIPKTENKVLTLFNKEKFPGKFCRMCDEIFYMDDEICKNCSESPYYSIPFSSLYPSSLGDRLRTTQEDLMLFTSISDLRKKHYEKLKMLKNPRKRNPTKKNANKKDKNKKKDQNSKHIYDLPKDIIIKIILMIKDTKLREKLGKYIEKPFPGAQCRYCASIYSISHPWSFVQIFPDCYYRKCRSCYKEGQIQENK